MLMTASTTIYGMPSPWQTYSEKLSFLEEASEIQRVKGLTEGH